MFSIIIYNGLKLLSKIFLFYFSQAQISQTISPPMGFLVLLERLPKVGNIELWVILAYGNLVTLNEIFILSKLKIGAQI